MSEKKKRKLQPVSLIEPVESDVELDELIHRLQTCAQTFQNMNQAEDNSQFIPLVQHLAQDNFIQHSNSDVRLLIACCLADIFRVFAPSAPYKSPEQIKSIFVFFIEQLKGLANTKNASFKRHLYLLESLACVKTFNVCIDLEDNQFIFCELFSLIFNTVSDEHSAKVNNCMLDLMVPLINEADSVSLELLDIILCNIMEPRKSQNRNAYCLARDLLKKTCPTIEPYTQAFINHLFESVEHDGTWKLYGLICELNTIAPCLLLNILPRLSSKINSPNEKDRLEVVQLLIEMFSDEKSDLISRDKELWLRFLGRFNDISAAVRNRCVRSCVHFLLKHQDLKDDITDLLDQRVNDPSELVRYEVVIAIISVAKKDIFSINEKLLEMVKERTLDVKIKVRKEAFIGLGMLYKSYLNPLKGSFKLIPALTVQIISSIKSTALHLYFQRDLGDRILAERMLHNYLVPYKLPTEEKVKRLFNLFVTIDDIAVKGFIELLHGQNTARTHLRELLELHEVTTDDETELQISQKINELSKSLPDSAKARQHLIKLNRLIKKDDSIKKCLKNILEPECLCIEAEKNARKLLKKMGNPVMTNTFYMTIKLLVERVAPILIDKVTVTFLVTSLEQVLNNDLSILDDFDTPKALEKGFRLLKIFATVFPAAFYSVHIYNKLISFLKSNNNRAVEITLQLLFHIGGNIESHHPEIANELIPIARHFANQGTGKQAKHAVWCLSVLASGDDREKLLSQIIGELKKNLHFGSPFLCTALISIGHIAYLAPVTTSPHMEEIISRNGVLDLIMKNREEPRDTDCCWCEEEMLSVETKAKIESMKLIVRWLLRLRSRPKAGHSALRLFTRMIESDGDMLKSGQICRPEMAWLKLTAGSCILKLVRNVFYTEAITNDQFRSLSRLIMDQNMPVREKFAEKLQKGLISKKLPLEYMAIYCLGANEANREFKKCIRTNIEANIKMQNNESFVQYTHSPRPEFIIPYGIHLLAHHPNFKIFNQVDVLQNLKNCLWFLLEPLLKSDTFCLGFFQKQIECIKKARDSQYPNDEMLNMKLYAVCDSALNLIRSKTVNPFINEWPLTVTLPPKLFSNTNDI